jgi:hypothetical protein
MHTVIVSARVHLPIQRLVVHNTNRLLIPLNSYLHLDDGTSLTNRPHYNFCATIVGHTGLKTMTEIMESKGPYLTANRPFGIEFDNQGTNVPPLSPPVSIRSSLFFKDFIASCNENNSNVVEPEANLLSFLFRWDFYVYRIEFCAEVCYAIFSAVSIVGGLHCHSIRTSTSQPHIISCIRIRMHYPPHTHTHTAAPRGPFTPSLHCRIRRHVARERRCKQV